MKPSIPIQFWTHAKPSIWFLAAFNLGYDYFALGLGFYLAGVVIWFAGVPHLVYLLERHRHDPKE